MDLVLLAVLAVVAALLYVYHHSTRQQRPGIPGPRGYPLIGSALGVKPSQMQHQFFELAREFGALFQIEVFGSNIVVLNSVDAINKAFTKHGHAFSKRPNFVVPGVINVHNSISFSNTAKEHAYAKKAFVQGVNFHGNGIPQFEEIVKGEIHRLMVQLENLNGGEFEPVGMIKRSIINVISMLLIGEEASDEMVRHFLEYSGQQDFFLNPLVNTTITHLPVLLRIFPYFKQKMDKLTDAQEKLVEKYFYAQRGSSSDDNRRGLTDWFLHYRDINPQREEILTDDLIKAIILTDVLTAGILTTSTVLPSALLCLISNPGYQIRLQEEIDRVIGDDREPTINDRHDCPFVEAVVMETTRYATPVPFLLPHVCSQDTTLDEYKIKAGSQVLANVWYVHHDETIWGDPWTFRPERFLDENGRLLPNTHHYIKSWMPFGSGRRKCPGMTLAMARVSMYLISLFQRYTFLPAPGNSVSCDPRGGNFVYDVIFKPRPFKCEAKLRKS